jgi:hypothetical protein
MEISNDVDDDDDGIYSLVNWKQNGKTISVVGGWLTAAQRSLANGSNKEEEEEGR